VLSTTLGAAPGESAFLTGHGASGPEISAGQAVGAATALPSARPSKSSPRPATVTGGGTASTLAGRRNPITWPFASNSIWNTPIGRGAVYVAGNIAPATQRTVATDQDVIVMDPRGPMVPIQYSGAGWSGASRCSGGTTLATAPTPPPLVVPGGGGNSAFAILMPDAHTALRGQPMARCSAGGQATT